MCKPLQVKLSVLSTSAERKTHAESFAALHNLSLLDSKDLSAVPTDYVLRYEQNSISLLQTKKGAPGSVSASFLGGKSEHRRKFGGGKGQLIARAVGLKAGITPQVLDATAGLGRDAFVLASLGCQVTMIERSPVIAELLSEALKEAEYSELSQIIERMNLLQVDAIEWLGAQPNKVADVIYLDPMYPYSDKSALVKKEMRAFHDLVGESLDDAALLAAALDKASYRVVVKRPRKGVKIEGVEPSLQMMGKSSRYDIYTLKAMADLKH